MKATILVLLACLSLSWGAGIVLKNPKEDFRKFLTGWCNSVGAQCPGDSIRDCLTTFPLTGGFLGAMHQWAQNIANHPVEYTSMSNLQFFNEDSVMFMGALRPKFECLYNTDDYKSIAEKEGFNSWDAKKTFVEYANKHSEDFWGFMKNIYQHMQAGDFEAAGVAFGLRNMEVGRMVKSNQEVSSNNKDSQSNEKMSPPEKSDSGSSDL